MSASIYWLPTNRKKSLSCWTPSRFVEAMVRAFGDAPWTLNETDLPTLRGMAAASDQSPTSPSGFSGLVTLVETHGEIKVWPEY